LNFKNEATVLGQDVQTHHHCLWSSYGLGILVPLMSLHGADASSKSCFWLKHSQMQLAVRSC